MPHETSVLAHYVNKHDTGKQLCPSMLKHKNPHSHLARECKLPGFFVCSPVLHEQKPCEIPRTTEYTDTALSSCEFRGFCSAMYQLALLQSMLLFYIFIGEDTPEEQSKTETSLMLQQDFQCGKIGIQQKLMFPMQLAVHTKSALSSVSCSDNFLYAAPFHTYNAQHIPEN